MTVNADSWKRFPIAARETEFDADDAIVRIRAWASGSEQKFASAFLWRNPQGEPFDRDTYRLPVIDVASGKAQLIPHAVFMAARFLSGAHGGLEDVISDAERKQLKRVVTEQYDKLRELFDDPRIVAPWLRGGNKEEEVLSSIVAAVNRSGWSSMPIADVDTAWDGDAARDALWSWADEDFRKYRRGFLWWDASAPELKGSYKLPIARPVDGDLTIIPRAVNAVAQVLGGARGGVDIPDDDMDAVQAVVNRIQKRFRGSEHEEESMTAASPLQPPAQWFTQPQFDGPTPIHVTADGRVMGHLAAWGVCHAGIGGACVTAPRSRTGYKFFRNGEVLTADGSFVKVGRITLGTGHADTRLGWIPASDHYDNTGTAVAVVASGEDEYGIWVAGSVAPGLGEEKIAELRRSPLSGDWRRINGNLELVAALAVNTPGFPIVTLNASGEPDALCAAGVVAHDGSIVAAGPAPELEGDDRDALTRLNEINNYVDKIQTSRRARRLAAFTQMQEVHRGMQ